jgi:transposase InsO family protein
MDTHKNASLTPKGRELMVRAVLDQGLSKAAAARAFHTSAKTVRKWVKRFLAHGLEGLRDRSSRPLSSPSKTQASTCEAIEVMRRARHTQAHIAAACGVSPATVSRVLKPRGLSRLSALEPQEPRRPRYERKTPGEIIHIDIKKLARFSKIGHRITGDRTSHTNKRGVGWEFVHVAIDDHSRVATARIFPNEKAASAIAFLEHAVDYYRSLGITVSRVMTDNGSCYRAKDFRQACARLDIKHLRTKPYTPQTNGKAERFIQSALREWAYATAFEHSDQRRSELPIWLHRYNWHRPHASLAKRTPISRLGLTGNNLLQTHI